MRLKVLILCFTIFYFTSISLYSKEKKILRWSSYQGKMSWENAKERCENIRMRLPTKLEILTAFKNKVTNSWKQDASIFWAEEEFSITDAFDQFVSFNPVYWTSEEAESHQAFGFHSVIGTFHKTNKLVLASVRCSKW